MGALVVLAAQAGPVVPGQTAESVVLVRNTGLVRDRLDVAIQGPAALWATADPPSVELDPGEEQAVWIRFTPPRTPHTAAGVVGFSVAVISRTDPSFFAIDAAVIEVAPFTAIRADLGPPDDRGGRWTRFPLTIRNDGNAEATVDLLLDGDGPVRVEVDRRVLRVAAGGSETVTLRAHGRPSGPPEDRRFGLVAVAGDELVRVEGEVPAGSTLHSELLRSAVALGTVLVVVAGVGLLLVARSGDRGSDNASLPLAPAATATTAAADAPPATDTSEPPGSSPVTIAPAGDPPASLGAVAFVRTYAGNQRDVVVRSAGARGGELRLRTAETEGRPALSPDRLSVAFVRERGGTWNVCVAPVSGGDATCLAPTISASSVAWSSAGDRAVFSRGVELWSVPVAGGEPERLPVEGPGDGRFSLSRDGTRIVFADGARLVVRAVDGSGGAQIAVPGAPEDPEWSPDGASIVYASEYQLYVAPAAGGAVRRLTVDGTVNAEPTWWDDWIVFRSNRSGGGDLYAVRADSPEGAEAGLARITSSPERDVNPSF